MGQHTEKHEDPGNDQVEEQNDRLAGVLKLLTEGIKDLRDAEAEDEPPACARPPKAARSS